MTRHVLVIDIGKTNAKLALVDLRARAEIGQRARPNLVRPGPPYPHADVEALWGFILDGLAGLHAEHGIDAITVTTHGATAALIDAEGGLVLPVLDYEHDGPASSAAAYDAVRPDFAETGSPRLPIGLNLGAQVFWQFRTFPEPAARVATILPYPQYWAYRLSGIRAGERTSLGCHTDLWAPGAGDCSTLVARQGWTALMPPLRGPGEVLGPILPELAARTGLDPATPVHCGIHDSNASLVPHLLARAAPFAVVSTGTWVVAMAVGGPVIDLDPGRDTLVNVDAFGAPVPSARFMGGREWELVMRDRVAEPTPAHRDAVLDGGHMLLPSVEPASGPFQGRAARWTGPEASGGERAVATSFYLALITSVCLGQIGAAGPVIVEGPFTRNRDYLAMLAAATGRRVLVPAAGGTGTSLGAALLTARDAGETPAAREIAPGDPRLADYRARWYALVEDAG